MSTTTSTKQQLSGKLPQNLSILQEEQAGCLCLVQVLESYCRNLIKKPWAFIWVPYMNPTILGVIGPGFLNQVPTLLCTSGPVQRRWGRSAV